MITSVTWITKAGLKSRRRSNTWNKDKLLQGQALISGLCRIIQAVHAETLYLQHSSA
jgi:hypothetical protein